MQLGSTCRAIRKGQTMGILRIILAILRALLNSRIVLAAEKFALRQQLADPRQSAKRPKLRPPDGLFWVVLFGLSKGWHREVIELFWRWKSRLTCPHE